MGIPNCQYTKKKKVKILIFASVFFKIRTAYEDKFFFFLKIRTAYEFKTFFYAKKMFFQLENDIWQTVIIQNAVNNTCAAIYTETITTPE